MSDRKQPTRHASAAIPPETIADVAYRVYLLRLEPPMTPEQAEAYSYTNSKTKKITNAAALRKQSEGYHSLTRDFLRVLVDLGMVKV